MFDEIIRSIRSHLYERAVSPLLGGLIVSWLLWNYKFVLVILSGTPVLEKFQIIKQTLYPCWETVALYGALYPVVTTLVYIYIYPHPARKVFEYARRRQKEIADIKKEIENETLLTVQDSRAIRREIYALEEEHQKELSRKNIEIENLKSELNSMLDDDTNKNDEPGDEESDSSFNYDYSAFDDALDEDQINILNAVAVYDEPVSEKEVVNSYSEGHVKAKYILGELVRLKYVKREYEQDLRDYGYTLTHMGRSFLVKHGHA